MPNDLKQRRALKLAGTYPSNQSDIRNALYRHHHEIGELQAELAELRALLRSTQETD